MTLICVRSLLFCLVGFHRGVEGGDWRKDGEAHVWKREKKDLDYKSRMEGGPGPGEARMKGGWSIMVANECSMNYSL